MWSNFLVLLFLLLYTLDGEGLKAPSFRFPSLHLPKPPAPNVFKSVSDFFRKKFSFQPPSIPTFGSNVGDMGPFRLPKLPSLVSFFNNTEATQKRELKEDGLPTDYFDAQADKKPHFLSELWHEKTRNSKGLLIYIVPALINQMALLHSISAFLFDRLAQYFQPMMVVLACALTTPTGVSIARKSLFFSISLGALYMFKDTISAGSQWAPLGQPAEDSYAIVTGATSGIGLMLVEMLYEEGYNLVLVARSDQTLKSIKDRLNKRGIEKARERGDPNVFHHRPNLASDGSGSNSIKTEGNEDRLNDGGQSTRKYTMTPKLQNVVTLSCDLRDSWTPNYIYKELEHMGLLKKIDILINNAGVGSTGTFIDSGRQENTDVIDLNVKSTVALTRLISPHMKRGYSSKHGGARILNVGSIAGCVPGPNAAVYSASKAFISSFTLALRRELMKDGIICCLAAPGPVRSRFAEVSGSQNSLIFKLPFFVMSSYDAATQIYFGMKQGRDIIVPGILPQIYSTFLARVLPTTVMADFVKFAWGPGLELRKRLMSLMTKNSDEKDPRYKQGRNDKRLQLSRPGYGNTPGNRPDSQLFDDQLQPSIGGKEDSTNSDNGYGTQSPENVEGGSDDMREKDSEGNDNDVGRGDSSNNQDATSTDGDDNSNHSFPKPKFYGADNDGYDLPSSKSSEPGSASEKWSKSWREKETKEENKRRRKKAIHDDSLFTNSNTYVF